MSSQRVAEYLMALDCSAGSKYCEQNGIAVQSVLPFEFTTSDEVYDCFSLLVSENEPLAPLFLNAEVWGLYLKDITEERYHRALELILFTRNPGEFMMYLRACYRFGFPVIDDESFNVLEVLYLKTFPWLSFLQDQTYDDDEYSGVVMDAIRMSGVKQTGKSVKQAVITGEVDSTLYNELNGSKSTSIRPVVQPLEAFEFWRNSPICRVHFSLKIDGVNTKVMFSDKEDKGLELALSRGRASDSIDYTEAVRSVLQFRNVDDTKLSGRVTGESFVPLSVLPILRSRYPDKEYKTPKSTAMAMLRAPQNFTPEDYQYLSFRAFSYGEFKPDEAFRKLEACGLQVPPYLEFPGEEIPRDSLESFSAWMDKNVLDPLYQAGTDLGIGSDGVVMYLLGDINTERRDKYSDSNIAIKYSHWSAASYLSKVTSIIFEQQRVEASIVLEIEPVVMRDSNTATRVGVGSPDILIRDGVKVGDTIEFERKSEAYNVYLRKRE